MRYLTMVLLVSSLLATGCATQSVQKTDKDGNVTRYKTTAIFNKTAFVGVGVDKTTKTTSQLLSVGSYGAETQADALAQFMTSIQGIFEAGLKAGAKPIVPVP